MGTIRTAVVGVGHFGRYHAEKLAANPLADLVAVADIDAGRARSVAAAHAARALIDYRDLLGAVDAVTIAVPTAAHHEIAGFFLDHGIHVLVEKPFTSTVAEADDLIARARARGLVLQVGHLERVFHDSSGLREMVRTPLYIEALRIAPFRPRGLDVSVIQDLMIHDIDHIVYLVDAPVVSVEAVGAPVLSEHEDIVNARLAFENGCVATVTASRIAFKSERRLRIFQPDCLISIDLLNRRLACVRRTGTEGSPDLAVEEREIGEQDALGAEISGFLEAVERGTEPLVSGEDAREALRIADEVVESLRRRAALVGRGMPDVPSAEDPARDGGDRGLRGRS